MLRPTQSKPNYANLPNEPSLQMPGSMREQKTPFQAAAQWQCTELHFQRPVVRCRVGQLALVLVGDGALDLMDLCCERPQSDLLLTTDNVLGVTFIPRLGHLCKLVR